MMSRLRQRIVSIRHGQDSRRQRQVLGAIPVRVARSVQSFVMRTGDEICAVEFAGKSDLRQNLLGVAGVLLHFFQFRLRKSTGTRKHGLRHADLAHVVQQAGDVYAMQILRGKPQNRTDAHSIVGDVARMRGRQQIPRVNGRRDCGYEVLKLPSICKMAAQVFHGHGCDVAKGFQQDEVLLAEMAHPMIHDLQHGRTVIRPRCQRRDEQ